MKKTPKGDRKAPGKTGGGAPGGKSPGKSPGKPGGKPAGKPAGKLGHHRQGGAPEGRKPAGKRALPGWLPDPGLARAMGGGGARTAPAVAPTADPEAAREATRYAEPIASREMILQVLAAQDGPMDAQALAEKLALTAPDRFDALGKRLSAMLRDGQLLQNRRGGFVPAGRNQNLIAGTVIANPDGFGFLRPESGEGDDQLAGLRVAAFARRDHHVALDAAVVGFDVADARLDDEAPDQAVEP
ncbi:MAG TPA: hypothetical protein VL118_01085, partial [Luteimonas sp.]|nr:hypothetical protein [Luteimonas sp.]